MDFLSGEVLELFLRAQPWTIERSSTFELLASNYWLNLITTESCLNNHRKLKGKRQKFFRKFSHVIVNCWSIVKSQKSIVSPTQWGVFVKKITKGNDWKYFSNKLVSSFIIDILCSRIGFYWFIRRGWREEKKSLLENRTNYETMKGH